MIAAAKRISGSVVPATSSASRIGKVVFGTQGSESHLAQRAELVDSIGEVARIGHRNTDKSLRIWSAPAARMERSARCNNSRLTRTDFALAASREACMLH